MMERILVNIIDVVNEFDGSSDKIFIYQEKDIQITSKGFKSLVNSKWVYYNLAKQEVCATDTGFERNAVAPRVQYRCKSFWS